MASKAKHLKTLYAVPHHAQNIKPVVDALVYAIAASGLTTRFGKVRKGENSWYLEVIDGARVRRFQLRSWTPFKTLFVKDSYRKGTVVARLENERDVLRFVNSL